MDKSDSVFSTYETEEIISQVRKKEKLVEKIIEEEELYGSKKQKLDKKQKEQRKKLDKRLKGKRKTYCLGLTYKWKK